MRVFPRGAAWSFRVCSLFSPSSRLATLGRGRSGGLRLDPLCLFPHAKISHGCCHSPLSFGGGEGGEREKRKLEEYLINLYSRNPLSSAIKFYCILLINSSVYSYSSSFLSLNNGDMDGWGRSFCWLGRFYLFRRAVLKRILSPPLLRLHELDRPACIVTSAIPTV